MSPRILRPSFALALLGLTTSNLIGWAANGPVIPVSHLAPLEIHEQQIWRQPVHNSQFTDVPHTTAKSRCERAHDPEALTTPNPLLDNPDADLRIRISFIVGTDGRVHSPLVLESGDGNGVQNVLATVRTWRYRPATCNGVPTETEGRIAFSSR